MKKTNIIYWVSTGLIFLFEGVMPALTSHTEMAKEGIKHLEYPEYFGFMLAIFKVVGSIVLIVPQVPAKYKEWAYVGFGLDFICAFISILAVDGLVVVSIAPLVFLAILTASYISYHKRQKNF